MDMNIVREVGSSSAYETSISPCIREGDWGGKGGCRYPFAMRVTVCLYMAETR